MSELQTRAPEGFLPGLSPKGGWFSDFQFHDGGLTVHKTGTKIRLDGTLIGECLNWFGYHVIVRARSWALAATRSPGAAIWFTPDKPRPWYLIWAAMAWSGCRMARSPQEADACFCFEDATWGLRALPTHERAFNFGCLDVSKSHVSAVFEEVFGYPLAIDPAASTSCPSGRIYIVDVNKTDVGPVIALSLRDKLASTNALAKALIALLKGDPHKA